jgi:hypothetical protein
MAFVIVVLCAVALVAASKINTPHGLKVDF